MKGALVAARQVYDGAAPELKNEIRRAIKHVKPYGLPLESLRLIAYLPAVKVVPSAAISPRSILLRILGGSLPKKMHAQPRQLVQLLDIGVFRDGRLGLAYQPGAIERGLHFIGLLNSEARAELQVAPRVTQLLEAVGQYPISEANFFASLINDHPIPRTERERKALQDTANFRGFELQDSELSYQRIFYFTENLTRHSKSLTEEERRKLSKLPTAFFQKTPIALLDDKVENSVQLDLLRTIGPDSYSALLEDSGSYVEAFLNDPYGLWKQFSQAPLDHARRAIWVGLCCGSPAKELLTLLGYSQPLLQRTAFFLSKINEIDPDHEYSLERITKVAKASLPITGMRGLVEQIRIKDLLDWPGDLELLEKVFATSQHSVSLIKRITSRSSVVTQNCLSGRQCNALLTDYLALPIDLRDDFIHFLGYPEKSIPMAKTWRDPKIFMLIALRFSSNRETWSETERQRVETYFSAFRKFFSDDTDEKQQKFFELASHVRTGWDCPANEIARFVAGLPLSDVEMATMILATEYGQLEFGLLCERVGNFLPIGRATAAASPETNPVDFFRHYSRRAGPTERSR